MAELPGIICPVCGNTLIHSDNCFKCENRHSFDIAKQGYVNLLSGASKGTHGDNKEMIKARKAFLEKGYYKALCDALTASVKAYCKDRYITLLDAGCGEGYYTNAVQKEINADIVGIDISKDALIYAAKKLNNATLAVASVYHMPLASEHFDVILNMFAPFDKDEYIRVLKKHGRLFMVIPGTEHLFELKSVLYDTPYKNRLAPFDIDGFELISKQNVTYEMNIRSNADLCDLFKMTPYYYRTSPENKIKLTTLDSITTTADFVILEYKRV